MNCNRPKVLVAAWSLVIGLVAMCSQMPRAGGDENACTDAAGGPQCCNNGGRRIPPCSEPRGTLIQWSYGTSFEAGPPGFDEPLATDRPDFTEASVTVGRGVAQLEFGYTYIFDREGGVNSKAHSVPEALLRVGMLADWFEFRIAHNHLDESFKLGIPPLSTTATGAEDLYLGIKLGLTPQEGILPEMALMPQMTVPTGSDEFTADLVLPGLNWLYGWDVNDFLSMAGSTQFNKALDEVTGDPFVEFAQSWTVGYSLAEKLGAYTEWFVLAPSGADTVLPQNYFNAGLTYQFTNNLQFDIRYGVGLNDAADDYFAGTGGAIRF